MKIEFHEDTGIPVIVEYEIMRRLIKKGTLANGYGEYYDLFSNIFYISPQAEKTPKDKWKGFIVDGDYYIYV